MADGFRDDLRKQDDLFSLNAPVADWSAMEAEIEAGGTPARGVLDLFGDLIPVDRESIAGAVTCYATYPQLSARDVLHVATCVANGITEIVSVDTGFDAVTEIRRIEPRELGEGA
ncbi:MAG: type II toxin-antitoxin system VapC family toxin [Pseudonocardiaceae bacterium]